MYRLETLLARKVTTADFTGFNALMLEYLDWLKTGEATISASQLTRSRFALIMLEARKAKKQEHLATACGLYQKAFDLDVPPVNKCVAALEFLFCEARLFPMETNLSPKMKHFYEDNKRQLTPTIINALRTEYALVEAKMAQKNRE